MDDILAIVMPVWWLGVAFYIGFTLGRDRGLSQAHDEAAEAARKPITRRRKRRALDLGDRDS
jgi:hypothetical protein